MPSRLQLDYDCQEILIVTIQIKELGAREAEVLHRNLVRLPQLIEVNFETGAPEACYGG